ncbi:MAG: DedA family protein [Pseudohongiellaceae bacterium]
MLTYSCSIGLNQICVMRFCLFLYLLSQRLALELACLCPGFFLVALSSIVVDQQLASLPLVALLAFFGALAGDHVGFYVGRWIGPHFHQIGVVEKRKSSFERAEKMIRYYGPFAVFIGRFIPAIRSIIPALLGITDFENIKFSILDSFACLLWAAALAAIVYGLDNIF